MTAIDIVVGGQFGSEAKGHMCAQLAHQNPDSAFVRVGGSNAGHSVVAADGTKFAFRHMPVSAVIGSGPLHLGPGSEVDWDVLLGEIALCEATGYEVRSRLSIDPQATIVLPEHKQAEADAALTARTGSTAKGVGAARQGRLARVAPIAADWRSTFEMADVAVERLDWDRCDHAVIEGTQGYGLGLHAGFYPFCTAGDCRGIDFLAQSGAPSMSGVTTWVVQRTYPIRVAGNSGPLANEVDWNYMQEITGGHAKPEFTTVTKKERRVGQWDRNLAAASLWANGYGRSDVSRVVPVLTFLDYIDPACYEQPVVTDHVRGWISTVEADLSETLGVPVLYEFGTTGPSTIVSL